MSRGNSNLNCESRVSFKKCLSSRDVQQLKLRLRTNKAVVRRALETANQQPCLGHPTSKPLLESLDCIGRVILQNIPFSAAIQGHIRRMTIVISCKSYKVRTVIRGPEFHTFYVCSTQSRFDVFLSMYLSLKAVHLLIH